MTGGAGQSLRLSDDDMTRIADLDTGWTLLFNHDPEWVGRSTASASTEVQRGGRRVRGAPVAAAGHRLRRLPLWTVAVA